jgi:hypothetical protein
MELDSDEESENQEDVESKYEEKEEVVEKTESTYLARSGRRAQLVDYSEIVEGEEEMGEEEEDSDVQDEEYEKPELSEYEKKRLRTLESNSRVLEGIMKCKGHGERASSSKRRSIGSSPSIVNNESKSQESSPSSFSFRPIGEKEGKKIKIEPSIEYFPGEKDTVSQSGSSEEEYEDDDDFKDDNVGFQHECEQNQDEGNLWSFQKRFPLTNGVSKEGDEMPETQLTKYSDQLKEVDVDSDKVLVFCLNTYYVLHCIRDTEYICPDSRFLQDENGNAFSFSVDFSSICGVKTLEKYLYGSNIVCIMETELDTIVFSSKFKIHYEQIYDRVLFPHGTRKTSIHRVGDLYARVGDTKRKCFLRLKLFDSRGRDISFQIKGDVTSNSFVYNQDVSFAPPGKQRTESCCSLVYLLIDSNENVLMFVCYPLKMCNSFHTISSTTECQRRGISMQDLMLEKHLKKQRKRGNFTES